MNCIEIGLKGLFRGVSRSTQVVVENNDGLA